MRLIMQALGAAVIATGVAVFGVTVCAPPAVADDETSTYTDDEENYLGYIDLFGDFWWNLSDEPYLLRAGYTACEEKRKGISKPLSATFMIAESDLDLTMDDAELIYDAAVMNLC